MIISKRQAQELINYFSNQFIDRNSSILYDGEVINELLTDLNSYVDQPKTCDSRNDWRLCTLNQGHNGKHMMYVFGKLITEWNDKNYAKTSVSS